MAEDESVLQGEFLTSSPSATDKLFDTAEDWWNNACLNWCFDSWWLYAAGYKDAADVLVTHVVETGRQHDRLVYPIVFLYRQHLELMIKDIIRQGRKLEDIDEPFPKSHHIDKLWLICRQLLSQISPNDSEEELDQVGRLIEEFSAVDPTSMSFRYPEDTDGGVSLPGVTHINLPNVKEVVGKMASILGGAHDQIDYLSSCKAEMYSEYYHDHDY
jgi:hypothetical protein